MPRETKAARAARTLSILEGLRKTYPDAHCELDYSNPLELLVATILSAQCTDKMVNRVTASLFRKYPAAAAYAEVPVEELAQDIKSLGFFRSKARSLQACCRALMGKHGGQVPASMADLVQLGGVGRKTANVVLGNAFNLNEGIVVDTHVARLAARMGLSSEVMPEKIERALMELVPRPQWTLFSHWLIWHGRRRCSARRPDCEGCEVRPLCPRRGVKARGGKRRGG